MSLEAMAGRLDTVPGYVEKDLWVCIVLDVLYNRLPAGHPNPVRFAPLSPMNYPTGPSTSAASELSRPNARTGRSC